MTRTSRRGSNTVRTHRHRERAAGHGGAVLQPAALGLLSRCLEPNSRCHCLTLIPTMPSSSWGSIRDRTPHVPAHVRGPNNQVRACGWHTMHKWFHTYSPSCCASRHLMTRCYRMCAKESQQTRSTRWFGPSSVLDACCTLRPEPLTCPTVGRRLLSAAGLDFIDKSEKSPGSSLLIPSELGNQKSTPA